mmetsp:Transcript_15154/g.27443  ORF Transcript_15154/g.27443 Transcript_15154/m.27443 type:complete len:430 (-) Transcript_15154:892-2181(-)
MVMWTAAVASHAVRAVAPTPIATTTSLCSVGSRSCHLMRRKLSCVTGGQSQNSSSVSSLFQPTNYWRHLNCGPMGVASRSNHIRTLSTLGISRTHKADINVAKSFKSGNWKEFSSTSASADEEGAPKVEGVVRLSQLLSQYATNHSCSRRMAERLISSGYVTVAGQVVDSPASRISLVDAAAGGGIVKIQGKRLLIKKSNKGTNDATMGIRVWLVHKLKGELVSEHDPLGRPSLLDRLHRSMNGKGNAIHLKPVGRLDMSTEGLLVMSNSGVYARDLELPSNHIHRTYRVRIHGSITPSKLQAIRHGLVIDGTRYRGMKVHLEVSPRGKRSSSTNTWLQITCTEGKNRQIRKVLDHLGLKVTRLIRTSFGDYDLNTIPPGMAIEIPMKSLESQRKRGPLFPKRKSSRPKTSTSSDGPTPPRNVEWIKSM